MPVPAPNPGAPGARVELGAVSDLRWAAAAREALAAADADD